LAFFTDLLLINQSFVVRRTDVLCWRFCCSAGSYDVEVTLASGNLNATFSRAFIVEDPIQSAYFVDMPRYMYKNDSKLITASALGGTNVSVFWSFGDEYNHVTSPNAEGLAIVSFSPNMSLTAPRDVNVTARFKNSISDISICATLSILPQPLDSYRVSVLRLSFPSNLLQQKVPHFNHLSLSLIPRFRYGCLR
jgi:hypothetical protein